MSITEGLIEWLPLIWLIVAIALGVFEAVTVDLVAIWFSAGAIVAILPASLGLDFKIQLLVFLVSSLALVYFTRPFTRKILKVKKVKTNADAVIGMMGIVIEDIDNIEEKGRVHVNGLDWTARSDDAVPMEKGSRVIVKAIEGVKVIVESVL